MQRWYVAEVKSLADDSLRALQAQSNVVTQPSVRPEARMLTAPYDPLYGQQPYFANINMEAAWAIETGDPSVVVAVVDSGIDMTHPDLRRNQWLNLGEICGNGIDDDNNGFVDDCRGYNFADGSGTQLEGDGSHGTHCAGIVAADSDNGVGVAGTAGGAEGEPGVSLMILTVFGKHATGGFDEAIVYGADNGAAISSNSWGCERATPAISQPQATIVPLTSLAFESLPHRLPAALTVRPSPARAQTRRNTPSTRRLKTPLTTSTSGAAATSLTAALWSLPRATTMTTAPTGVPATMAGRRTAPMAAPSRSHPPPIAWIAPTSPTTAHGLTLPRRVAPYTRLCLTVITER